MKKSDVGAELAPPRADQGRPLRDFFTHSKAGSHVRMSGDFFTNSKPHHANEPRGLYSSGFMAETSIPYTALAALLETVDHANARVAEHYPGELPKRQPVHTVYGGAHLFKADLTSKLGTIALGVLNEHAPEAATLADAVGLNREIAAR